MKDSLNPIFLLLAFLLSFVTTGCSSGDSDSEFQSVPPLALQALQIPLYAFVVVSTEPEERTELVLDPETGNFRGRVIVPTGSSFDLTVIYEGDEPAKGQRVGLAHYIRSGLVADGPEMSVRYLGDEANWQILFEGIPSLDLDGDGYGNFAELVYGSDLYSKDSLPEGAKASATHKEPFLNTDVSLPAPGVGITSAMSGTEEIVISANTPFTIQELSIVSPTYGVQVQTPAGEILKTKKMTVLIETDRFVVGDSVGVMSLTVRVKDKYNLVRDTVLTFAVYNKEDHKPPSRVRLGLKPGQVLTGPTTFVWELDDPSGIDPSSVSVKYEGHEDITIPVVDKDPSPNRLSADISLPLSLSNGKYTVKFEAKDLKGNLYQESVPVEIGRSGNQKPLFLSLTVSPSPKTDNFNISWAAFDGDGEWDIAGYDVTLSDSKGSPVITCTGLKASSIKAGDDLSACALSRVGYGELLNPFRLAPQTDYTVTVTVKDTMGAFAQGVTSFTVLDSALVAWWRFDEGSGVVASDSSGKGRDGTIQGGASRVDGVSGKAVSLDGTGSVDLGSSNKFIGSGQAPFSASVWIYPTAIPPLDGHSAFMIRLSQESQFILNFYHNSSETGGPDFIFAAFRGQTQWAIPVDLPSLLNKWNQIVVVYNGGDKSSASSFEIYLNGDSLGHGSFNFQTAGGSCNDNVIGSDSDGNICNAGRLGQFNGQMDEVMIYNRTLTVDEIRRDCRRNDPTGTTCPDPKSPVILLPTPGEQLPPTKAIWVWRSEKDPVGNLLYPNQTYDVAFDKGNNDLFGVIKSDLIQMSDKWYTLRKSLDSGVGYTLRICPSGTNCSVSSNTADPQRGTRTFSTTAPVVSWWSFNEGSGDAVDSISAMNGPLMNGLARTAGINESALSLDDRGNYVNLGDAPRLKFDTGSSFMIEAWVRRNSTNSPNDDTIFSKMDMTYPWGTGYYFAIYSGGTTGSARVPNTLNFIMRHQNNTSRWIEARTEKTIEDANWHHVAVSYTGSRLVDASSIRLYMDGQSQKVIPVVNALSRSESVDTPAEARIGASRSWGGGGGSVDNVFNGLMDEVMVYQDDANPGNLSPAVICNSYLTTCLTAGLSCDFSCVPQ